MELISGIRKLYQSENGRWLFLVAVMAVTHMLFQSLLLPYGNALRSLLPDSRDSPLHEKSLPRSSAKIAILRNPLTVNVSDITDGSASTVLEKDIKISDFGNENGFKKGVGLKSDVNRDVSNDFESENVEDLDEQIEFERFEDEEDGYVVEPFNNKSEKLVSLELVVKQSKELLDGNHTNLGIKGLGLVNSNLSELDNANLKHEGSNSESFLGSTTMKNHRPISQNDSLAIPKQVKKKMRCEMPPKSVTTFDEMNRLLLKHRRSSRAARPRWASKRDEELLAARSQIENAPDATNDRELYAPIFRNLSTFKRSYELMERTLKIFVYKEGNRPIFHTPILKGLYASEGWFMKLMEGNKRFVVKDPRKAHLFYMPFSSRMLEYTLYVRNSHNRTNLRQFLKEYSDKIAAKYPFWNRTGGANHFLVACHDWAPYETRHHMEHCIKALCNADVTAGFKIGRDVSFPETYVRAAKNPLRDLGGKPPSQRHILAFYAGNMHGYLRPFLLNHWKDKDPNMKIFGPMPRGVASKMNYIGYMKSSKYCVCPKGYEVNSPRVVESLFYECVPVIISDNFVPPFFDVLNWEAFSVIVAEKDVPRLKQILVSIPEEKYAEKQRAVRKAQRHFLWHAKPEKYDLFHMTLHSVWYNRVFQVKRR